MASNRQESRIYEANGREYKFSLISIKLSLFILSQTKKQNFIK